MLFFFLDILNTQNSCTRTSCVIGFRNTKYFVSRKNPWRNWSIFISFSKRTFLKQNLVSSSRLLFKNVTLKVCLRGHRSLCQREMFAPSCPIMGKKYAEIDKNYVWSFFFSRTSEWFMKHLRWSCLELNILLCIYSFWLFVYIVSTQQYIQTNDTDSVYVSNLLKTVGIVDGVGVQRILVYSFHANRGIDKNHILALVSKTLSFKSCIFHLGGQHLATKPSWATAEKGLELDQP